MTQRVQAVERALNLLEALVDSSNPPTIPELAKAAGVNRSTTWRLMNTLVHFELAENIDNSGHYRIGSGAIRLSVAADGTAMVRRARPVLESVAERTGGSAFLEVATRGRLVVIDYCRSNNPIQVDVTGLDVPLHCGSVGKLYLASLPDSELDVFFGRELEALTQFTLTDPATLREEIYEARENGFAYNYKEHREEWCGISASIRDRAGRTLAYLNVTLPTFNTTKSELRDLTPIMSEAAREIEELFINLPK
ncbi:MAG: IclR family transcriptional regulator [Candidatus Nanopelagicaceae bacterium]|nr:IclR family transcriptional regulator [Candidatus Nanopelagicaceae bacterium]